MEIFLCLLLPMYSSEFAQYFDTIEFAKKHFLGVFPRDKIPQEFELFSFAVLNSATSLEPGVHWLGIIKTAENLIEIFDSLSFDETFLTNFKLNSHYTVVYNTTAVQSKSSQACGYFVIFFLLARLFDLDLSFTEVLNEHFSSNLKQNEELAIQFCKDLLENGSGPFKESTIS